MTSNIVIIVQAHHYDLHKELEAKLTKLRNQYIKVRPTHTSMTSQIPDGEEDMFIVMAVTVEIGG